RTRDEQAYGRNELPRNVLMNEIKSLKALIHELSRLPGIGERSAQRMAYFLLKKGPAFMDQLRVVLKDVQDKVKLCPECFAYTETEGVCDICTDPKRQSNLICVVESPPDILKIDASDAFSGRYHVLHGAIAPLEGVH